MGAIFSAEVSADFLQETARNIRNIENARIFFMTYQFVALNSF
ncbi:hypothetical protein C723_0263 [Christiangramia flava JLT2011]|uniref:Uncharacterized protein n=1 Tax=Christiangramia flava JLT2011 TaxID=1229726 RepID=A0A1L7I422_9FLAO|nr:hypothetical protein GRFL_1634 [Christiangramia flava JLT2011]OSS40854.1 hypothetical protein C723_0263 [Christiangramia flava JLT2011]